MKISTIIFFAFLISINTFSQPDIKGYKVGEPLGQTIIPIVGELYGIGSEDYIFGGKNYSYGISGMSKDKFEKMRSISSETELQNLVSAFENKCQFKFNCKVDFPRKTWDITQGDYYYRIIFNIDYKVIFFDIYNEV